MKRYVIILLIFLAISTNIYAIDLGTNVVTVTFGGVDASNFGFSKKEVTPSSFNPDSIIVSKDTTSNDSGNTESNSGVSFSLQSGVNNNRITDVFFIYWRIFLQESVTISITGLTPLIPTDVTESSDDYPSIPVSSTFAIKGNNVSSSTNFSPIEIFSDTDGAVNTPRIGSTPIQLQIEIDENLSNSIQKYSSSRTYVGSLTIEFKTNG